MNNESSRLPHLSLRNLVVYGAFAAVAASHAQTRSLGDMAKDANLNFGLAVGSQFFTGNAAYREGIRTGFNMFVNENDMKFGSVEPSRGRFSFDRPAQVLAFAEANGIKMRGHTLVWHNQSGWADGKFSRAEMLGIMKLHIETTVGRFKGKILEWDVVNEGINDGNAGTLRSTFWKNNIGDDYIDSAFAYAHRADPAAFLFYNDYSADGLNPKSNAVYAMVKRMKEKGLPIHGVGLQAHFTNGTSKADISKNIKRLGDLGLRVSLTEIEIVDPAQNPKLWTDLLGACLENFNCTSFMVWGFDDAHSWKTANGTCNCLLYDTAMKPKPAIQNALREKLAAADPAVSLARKAFAGGGGTALSDATQRKPIAARAYRQRVRVDLFPAPGEDAGLYNVSGKRQASIRPGF